MHLALTRYALHRARGSRRLGRNLKTLQEYIASLSLCNSGMPKNVELSDKAYGMLLKAKRPGESLSDTIIRNPEMRVSSS